MPEFDLDAALTAKAEEPVAPPFPSAKVRRWFPDSVLWDWSVDWSKPRQAYIAFALFGETRRSASWEAVAVYDPATGVWGG